MVVMKIHHHQCYLKVASGIVTVFLLFLIGLKIQPIQYLGYVMGALMMMLKHSSDFLVAHHSQQWQTVVRYVMPSDVASMRKQNQYTIDHHVKYFVIIWTSTHVLEHNPVVHKDNSNMDFSVLRMDSNLTSGTYCARYSRVVNKLLIPMHQHMSFNMFMTKQWPILVKTKKI